MTCMTLYVHITKYITVSLIATLSRYNIFTESMLSEQFLGYIGNDRFWSSTFCSYSYSWYIKL